MRREIVTEENEHFDYVIGKDGETEKRILSNQKITKKILITYDDDDNEINREAYVEPTPIDLSNLDINQLSISQLTILKQKLNSL